jgi:predicted lipid-binding transport protein (Tim44 family)
LSGVAQAARLSLTLVALLGAADALARAGGGGHSGGGGMGSGGGGFGPSIGHTVGYVGGSSLGSGGLVTLIVIGVVIFVIYRRISAGGGSAGGGADDAMGAALGAAIAGQHARGPGPVVVTDRALPAAIAQIRARDPGFEIETFMQRAEMAFFLVRRGIQRNDAMAVRPYLDDATFALVARNIGEMKAQHRHELLESLNVRALHLTEAACDERGQSLEVHFDLVYRAKMVDDANRVLGDEGEDHRHGERWTFARAPDAKTPEGGGVTASRCPACGGELKLGLDGTCAHCRASVTNGSLDWVVARVAPTPFVGFASDSQFASSAPTVGEGLDSLRAADPAFDLTAFLARVNTAFLALQDAWCRQQLEAGRAFLSPGAYFAWSAQLETLAAEGRRNVMEGLTVTGIAPLRVVHGRVFDDLTVRISAASADYEVDAGGRVVFGDREVRPFTERWTFQRSTGVATSDKPGTLESQCPNCGAPLQLTQIGECRYCRAAVTSGRFDWVVSRIEQDDEGTDDTSGGGGGGDLAGSLAASVGGAIVGGLLGSLLSGNDAR